MVATASRADAAALCTHSFPLTIEDYVHRIGRTGRAGATGTAHTFFCQQDKCVPRAHGRPPPTLQLAARMMSFVPSARARGAVPAALMKLRPLKSSLL